jgi:anaerobic selenocysteine-containing dehydrogenase
MSETRTALRICPLCEATCGLTLSIEDGRVTAARGDRDDVFSAGFICPKGASFPELDNDPDRLSRPMVRKDGELTEVGWDEAFAAAAQGLGKVLSEHGGASVAVYLGNPNAHTIAGALYAPLVIRGLGTRQVYTASTLDQMPKHVALGHLFGNPLAFTVPDVDRTDHLVVIGANPLVSNGSVATAADFAGKLKALRKRGGRLTVIDPARTRTAELADRHIAPRPGTDAALLMAVAHVLFDEHLVAPDLGGLAEHVLGDDAVRALVADFPPEVVAVHCGVAADDIRTLAREIAAHPRPLSTAESARPQSNSARSAIGSSTSSISSPGTSTDPAARCSRSPRCRPLRAHLGPAAAGGPAAGTAGSPGIRRCSPNSRPPRCPRRSRRRVRARSRR